MGSCELSIIHMVFNLKHGNRMTFLLDSFGQWQIDMCSRFISCWLEDDTGESQTLKGLDWMGWHS